MVNIGIIGTKTYSNLLMITKLFETIKYKFGPYATIMTGGNDSGAEHQCKKLALELGLNFKEFNPSYTGYRVYSAMDKSYYGKSFHPSHLTDRYKHLINSCKYIFIFEENGSTSHDIEYAKKLLKKTNKIFKIIN